METIAALTAMAIIVGVIAKMAYDKGKRAGQKESK
jgi:hypothetical protein